MERTRIYKKRARERKKHNNTKKITKGYHKEETEEEYDSGIIRKIKNENERQRGSERGRKRANDQGDKKTEK